MNILRRIGASLKANLAGFRSSPQSFLPVGRGAAGDKTYGLDKMSEDIIFAELRRLNMPFTIISEEAGIEETGTAGHRVIIDPLDGSKNAILGIPCFSVSIAVADGDRLRDVYLSYVLNLPTGDEFWAERNRGSFMNEHPLSCQEDDTFSLVAYEAQSPSHDIKRITPLLSLARKTRCFGSVALDLAYVAHGAISVFVCPAPSRSFDYAGGWLLVREAGGIMTDLNGFDMGNSSLDLGKTSPFLASGNSHLHEKALKALTAKEDHV